MRFLLMTLQAFPNYLNQADIQNRRQHKVLVQTSLPAQGACGHRFRPQFWQAKFFEGDAREIQTLRSAVIGFSIHAALVVPARIVLDAFLGLRKQDRARTKNYRAGRAHAGASRFLAFLQPMVAQLAFRDARIVALPLKTRHVIRTSNCAVTAADAFVGGPGHDATLRILMQSLEWAAGSAGRIETMHALTFYVRKR